MTYNYTQNARCLRMKRTQNKNSEYDEYLFIFFLLPRTNNLFNFSKDFGPYALPKVL